MHKFFLLLSLFVFTILYGAEKVEIYAGNMDSKDNSVLATDGVTVVYSNYIVTADSATYDRESGDLELQGNVRVNKGKEYKLLGNQAKINIKNKKRSFQPFYMEDESSQVWLSAAEGKTSQESIDIKSGILSGCDPVDPIWQIEFSSMDYDTGSKWMNIYNARLYIEDIPIFYTPYFGYSLDRTRRTGLLKPALGYSSGEGFYYEQPIYLAPQNWWDLEFRPQIRTRRGKGVYETFRFIDSPTSRGEFTAGYFKEKDEYFTDKQLKNQNHYGFQFKYDSQNFLNKWFGLNLDGQSLIYADINFMNDVEYRNLSSNNTQNTNTATQILSRVNMFYNTDQHYIGSYFKYYQDLDKENNDATLQKIPTLQYHYYLNTLLDDHILYNLDVQSNNITRQEGTTVVQTNLNLPIVLQTSLFDEYLNVSYSANLFMQHSDFGNQPTPQSPQDELNNGYIARNYHTVSMSSQLTKGYEDYSHVVSLSLAYSMKGSESRDGYYEDNELFCSDLANASDPRCEFYQISQVQDEAQVEFIQYLYDDKSSQVIYHRLSQLITNSEDETLFGELENELDYKVTSYLKFYNDMFFNYKERKFSKLFNKVSLSNYGATLELSHLYKNSFDPADKYQYTSYLTSSFSYNYDKHYSFKGLYNYDIETKEPKTKEIGFMYKKRCWDFGIRYSENRQPITIQTATGTESSYIDEKYLYFTILLKPIMQPSANSVLTYKFPDPVTER